jgi:VIT1/CCC1 family predicted Fe2+/Mn2+ transporter
VETIVNILLSAVIAIIATVLTFFAAIAYYPFYSSENPTSKAVRNFVFGGGFLLFFIIAYFLELGDMLWQLITT